MPHINLLPWREELRKQRQQEFGIMAGIAAVAMGVVVLLVHLQAASMIEYQQSRNQLLDQEIGKLDKKIKEIKDLERERESLIARMQIVERLQTSRPEVVHLFDEMVDTLPEGLYLTGIKQKGRKVEIEGVAQSNARVSSFMRQLEKSTWLDSPDLKLIQASKNKDSDLKLSNFKLSVNQTQMKKADEDAKGKKKKGGKKS